MTRPAPPPCASSTTFRLYNDPMRSSWLLNGLVVACFSACTFDGLDQYTSGSDGGAKDATGSDVTNDAPIDQSQPPPDTGPEAPPPCNLSAPFGTATPLGDPIERLKRHLIVSGDLTDEAYAERVKEIEAMVFDASQAAEASGTLHGYPVVSPATMFDDVYATAPPHLLRQRQDLGF